MLWWSQQPHKQCTVITRTDQILLSDSPDGPESPVGRGWKVWNAPTGLGFGLCFGLLLILIGSFLFLLRSAGGLLLGTSRFLALKAASFVLWMSERVLRVCSTTCRGARRWWRLGTAGPGLTSTNSWPRIALSSTAADSLSSKMRI